jgi:hypothetical protein
MALRFCPRIVLRRARQGILGLLVAGATAALPVEAPAAAISAPAVEKAYVAFFLGQGDYLFSWGIPVLESEARKLGLATDVFSYTDVTAAWTSIVRRRNDGYKIALVGYSLGNTTATYLQRHLPVDLLLAISESSLGRNHPIKKENTRRAVLWYGPDMLSNAGVHDGFDDINYIDTSHLMMDLDPRVVTGVLDELKSLVAPKRRDETPVMANVPVPVPRPNVFPVNNFPISDKTVTAAAPSAGWLPPVNVITPDVTCANCWGFTPNLGAAEDDPWMHGAH